MIDYITVFFPLFAETSETSSSSGDGGFGMLFMMLPFFLILYWLFMLRPQQKQEEKQRKMMNSLDKNDRVMTVGGIIAAVHSVDKEKNEIILKVDDSNGTKIKFHLSAVSTVFPKDSEKTDTK
jgi:preprotein translocase subunit YajC